jgi:tRNA modification GTPase
VYPLDDTIVAVASPPGGAGRGIVRLSGPALRKCLEPYFRPSPSILGKGTVPCSSNENRDSPPIALLSVLTSPAVVSGVLWLPGFAAPLPCDLYLWPGGRSSTGQPVAEIHTIGSQVLLEAVLHALCAAGARLAQPGEFTLRAFLAGRIDLTQAEAVAGVVDARDDRELHAALTQLAGGLAAPLGRLRTALVDLLVHLEAGLDFADEDLQFITPDELSSRLDAACVEARRLTERLAFRGQSGELVRAVLVGPPNSGKSSLFNALVRGGALVSDQPGTTRDYLTAQLDLDGLKCLLIDTAGIEGPVEGQGRGTEIHAAAEAAALQQASRANVQLLCIDASQPLDNPLQACGLLTTQRILVLTKADLATGGPLALREMVRVRANCEDCDSTLSGADSFPPLLATSSVTGEGLDTLRQLIRDAVLAANGPCGDVVAGTALRSSQSLCLAAEGLDRARQLTASQSGEELVAAEVRIALAELGKVAGAVYTEDLLDRIFSRFCIGK